ncbi:MAG TPA: GNAT family N-acetyltransferase [Thermoleophilaceae bacterium]
MQVRASADLRSGLGPGDIGAITSLHGREYADEWGLDYTFEAYVGESISRFAHELARDTEAGQVWIAEDEDGVAGCIAITRLSESEGWLRWFVIDRRARGQGLGRRLLTEALAYARERFEVVRLETFSELTTAGHLYRSAGFTVTDSEPRDQWGREIELQHYEVRF